MQPLYKAEEMRTLDSETIENLGLPGIVLMEHAGYKSALIIKDKFPPPGFVTIICGKGNNGGDGFVIARWLKQWGYFVNVILLTKAERLKGDAKINCDVFRKLYPEEFVEAPDSIEIVKKYISECEIVVDAILGTGLEKPLSGYFLEVVKTINESGKFVFSVDIPSGLPSDSGRLIGECVKANITATYGGLKRAHFVYPARKFVGEVYLVDICIPESVKKLVEEGCFLVEEDDVKKHFPERIPDAHKGNFGHLAILTGSPGKTGAGIMAGEAALKTGVGLVTLYVPESLNIAYEANTLEVMSFPLKDNQGYISSDNIEFLLSELENKDALAIGPGLGQHEDTLKLIEKLISECNIPMVIDADGINLIAKKPEILKKKKAPIILTPHPGELSRLIKVPTQEINQKRLETALEWAKKLNIILVVKGAGTITAIPEGRAFINPTGNPGMASGGSGDVLTGIIGALLAMGITPEKAAYAGVFLHGLSADVAKEATGEYSLTASDMIEGISIVLKSWEEGVSVWKKTYTSL